MIQLPADPEFIRELWSLYGVGMVVLILRFFVRLRTVGLRKFQGDDVFAFILIGIHTVDIVTVYIVHKTGTNAEAVSYAAIAPLNDDDIAQFEYGSKVEFVAWYSYVNLIWCLKASMLFFYRRVSIGNTSPRLIWGLAIGSFMAYLVVISTITFGCWPIQKNWQVLPYPGEKCTIRKQNVWVSTIFNVVTDLAILSIPIPLLGVLQVPLRKKLFIGILLCSGVFIIAAAIIRATVTLSAHPSSIVVNSWSVRETIVGLLAINIPILRPLFSYTFWKRGTLPDTRSPRPPAAAAGSFRGPIRRVIRGPFSTLFSLNSLFTTIATNKTTTTIMTKMTQSENNQDAEAAIQGQTQLPQVENNEVVQPMADHPREKEEIIGSNCEGIRQGDSGDMVQQGNSISHGSDRREVIPIESDIPALRL